MSTWNTEDMANALPEPVQNQATSAGASTQKPVLDQNWGEREATNYEHLANPPTDQAWDGCARVYEWNDEYGEIGPEFPELELELFGDPSTRHEKTGIDFSKIESIDVIQEGPVKINPIKTFDDAGLHPAMRQNVKLAGYDVPTPIQKFTVPSILQGHDVIGIAQTGSGKTASYLVPILSKLMGKAKKLAAPRPNPGAIGPDFRGVKAEPLVLVVVPTRELAFQIFNEARKFCYRTMLRPSVAYGGIPMREQFKMINMGCDVLIGTPGRLVDLMQRPDDLSLNRLKYMVIDEADEMLNDDWAEAMETILNGGDQDLGNVKFALFSATFPKAARDLAKEHLSASHVRFMVGRAGRATESIVQTVLEVEHPRKREELLKVLNKVAGARTIIFCNSRQAVDNLDDYLYNIGLPVTSIHSDRTQMEREAAMRAFRAGKAPILIATGVTARGIDVKNVQHVINFDLPSMDHGGIEEYTHRIGRTGRMGARGMATSFFTERDEPMGSVLVRTLLETKQEVPDFLEPYAPVGQARDNLKFETESDFDENEMAGGGGAPTGDDGDDAWGSGGGEAPQPQQEAGGWGGAPTEVTAGGWVADHAQDTVKPENCAVETSGWGGDGVEAQAHATAAW